MCFKHALRVLNAVWHWQRQLKARCSAQSKAILVPCLRNSSSQALVATLMGMETGLSPAQDICSVVVSLSVDVV